jgi:hypothetical protein
MTGLYASAGPAGPLGVDPRGEHRAARIGSLPSGAFNVPSAPMSDRDDLNELLNGVVDVATDQLTADSEFAPFALAMQDEGDEIFQVEPEEDELDQPPDEVIGMLFTSLREAALLGRFRATALAADVTLEDDDGQPITSAIHVAMEHREGEPVNCLIPYEIAEDGTVELGDLMAEPGSAQVFDVATAPKDLN